MTVETGDLEIRPRESRALGRVLQLGAITIVVAVATFHRFELDRFFVPKELALHLCAIVAFFAGWSALRSRLFDRLDRCLVLFLFVSSISTIFATNSWLGFRALAITASSVLLFLLARGLEGEDIERVTRGVAVAVILVQISSLLQAYGLEVTWFSENRAPGGTLGNRNFVAHVAAIGWPLLLSITLSARSARGAIIGSIGSMIVVATLVLTRSRGAWLAFALAALLTMILLAVSPSLRSRWQTWRRIALITILSLGGVAAAILLPNDLRWRSDNPYLETVERIADYEEGSGRGRLIQYQRTVRLLLRSPLLGVGPGNWAVRYPEVAGRADPSLDPSQGGMTSNPWPSSDWVAMLSERGPVAFGALVSFFVFLLFTAMRGARSSEPWQAARSIALAGWITATLVAGAFDAVLLLALPSLLFWIAAGALLPRGASVAPRISRWQLPILVLLALISAGGAVRSSAQTAAMQLFETSQSSARLENAARIDPSNFRVRMKLARSGDRKRRCEHAVAARKLYPHSAGARQAARGCR
jgi:O-antigen ligase